MALAMMVFVEVWNADESSVWYVTRERSSIVPAARTTSPRSSPPRRLRVNSRSCIPPNTPRPLSLAGNAASRSVARRRFAARLADVERAEHPYVRAAERVRAEERVRPFLLHHERLLVRRAGVRSAVRRNHVDAVRVLQLEAMEAVEHLHAHGDGVADGERLRAGYGDLEVMLDDAQNLVVVRRRRRRRIRVLEGRDIRRVGRTVVDDRRVGDDRLVGGVADPGVAQVRARGRAEEAAHLRGADDGIRRDRERLRVADQGVVLVVEPPRRVRGGVVRIQDADVRPERPGLSVRAVRFDLQQQTVLLRGRRVDAWEELAERAVGGDGVDLLRGHEVIGRGEADDFVATQKIY